MFKESSTRIAVTLLIALSLNSCNLNRNDDKEKSSPIQAVKVTKPETMKIKREFETATTAKAIQESYINPKVSAEIEEFFVDEGANVKKEERLARLNKKDYVVGAAAAKARLKAAKAGLLQAEAAFDKVKLDFERYKRLLEKNSVSRAEFDQVKSGYDQAGAAVEVAKAQVLTAKSSYRGLQLKVSYTTIRAPFEGYVAELNGEIGQMASPQSPQAMFRIVNLKTLKLEVYISELEIGGIDQKTPVEVYFDAYPDVVEEGIIHTIGDTVNPATKSVRVEVRVDNSDRRYKAGISARVRIDMPEHEYMVIPRNSIFTRDNEAGTVFVLTGNNTVSQKEIVMGDTHNGMTAVIKGLKGDETVVVGGGTRLETGQKVNVVN